MPLWTIRFRLYQVLYGRSCEYVICMKDLGDFAKQNMLWIL